MFRPGQVDILVACGTASERKALASLLSKADRYRGSSFEIAFGELHGLIWAIVQPEPASAQRLSRTLSAVRTAHHPRLAVVAQLAVALSNELRAGTLVQAEQIVLRSGDEQLVRLRLQPDPGFRARAVTVLSVDRWPAKPETRRRLHEATGAAAAAVRAYSLSAALASEQLDAALYYVPWSVGEALSGELLAMLGPTFGFRVGAAVAAITQGGLALSRFQQAGAQAGRILASFAQEVTARLAAAVA